MSTVMMGLVAFPVIEMLMAFVHKDRKTGWLFFKMVFFLGLAAIAGFTVAVCIHAPLKGNGSIIDGIKAIPPYAFLFTDFFLDFEVGIFNHLILSLIISHSA